MGKKTKQVPEWVVKAIPLMLVAMLSEREKTEVLDAEAETYKTKLLNATIDEIEKIKKRDGTEELDKKQRREATLNARKIVKKSLPKPKANARSEAEIKVSQDYQKERERRAHTKRENEAKLRQLANQHIANQKGVVPPLSSSAIIESKIEQIRREISALERSLVNLEAIKSRVENESLTRTALRAKKIAEIPQLKDKLERKRSRVEDYIIAKKLGLEFKKGVGIDAYEEIINQTKAKQEEEIRKLEQPDQILNDKELTGKFYDIILIDSNSEMQGKIQEVRGFIEKLTATFNATFEYLDIRLGTPNIEGGDLDKFKVESMKFILNTAAALKEMTPAIAVEQRYNLTPEQRGGVEEISRNFQEIVETRQKAERILTNDEVVKQVDEAISKRLFEIDKLPLFQRVPEYFVVLSMFICDIFHIDYFRKKEEPRIREVLAKEAQSLKTDANLKQDKNRALANENAVSILALSQPAEILSHVKRLNAREGGAGGIARA